MGWQREGRFLLGVWVNGVTADREETPEEDWVMMSPSLGLLVVTCPWDVLLALSYRQESPESSPAWKHELGSC